MNNLEYKIRVMTIEDYEQVHDLWMSIHGFGIRSIDDSYEGVERFIKRNPTTSVVAVADGRIVGSILCGLTEDEDVFITYVCMRISESMVLVSQWQLPV